MPADAREDRSAAHIPVRLAAPVMLRATSPFALRSCPVTGHRDFAEFYGATFHKLASVLYVYTGDLAESQDVVQEAMIRALAHWGTVSTYDEPAAWVRRVAWNLATSRCRRRRNRRRAE